MSTTSTCHLLLHSFSSALTVLNESFADFHLALGRYPSDTVFLAVSRIAAIVTLDDAAVSPSRLHGNPRPATKRELFGRKRQTMYRALIMRRISAR